MDNVASVSRSLMAAAAVAAVRPLPVDHVLSAVRLTGGIGGTMTIAAASTASILLDKGRCSEVVGALSVGLLGVMLMFSGMLPITQGADTNIVWATGLLQFALIFFIALSIVRILTLAKACPTFKPGASCKSNSISEFRRGMAKASAGISLLALMYLLMVVPGPDSGIDELFTDLLGRVHNLGGHIVSTLTADNHDLGDGVGGRDFTAGGVRARMRAFMKAFYVEGRGVVAMILAAALLGTGIGLPFTGVDAMADACAKTTAG